MPRYSREEEIIGAIRRHLIGAVKGLEPISDKRLMKAADCSRTTFYKYVREGSEIKLEIEGARAEQRKYAASEARQEEGAGDVLSLRKRLEVAEAGDRNLLALIARMEANLTIRYGVSEKVIQAAKSEEIPHPNRNFSHAGRGRRRK